MDLETHFENSGEKERLKELARQRLIECGWRDELKNYCKELIRQRGGLNNVSVEGLVQTMTPRGHESIPESVRNELRQHIRKYLDSPPKPLV